MVATHTVNRDFDGHIRSNFTVNMVRQVFLTQVQSGLSRFNDLLAAVNTRRRNVVTAMNFTRRWLDGQRRIAQGIMGTMHATLRRGFFVLLNSHVVTPD
jgi:hypothetical protein